MSDQREVDVPRTTVIVIAISSAAHIRRCLRAIETQPDPGSRETIVAADARIGVPDDLRAEFPNVRFLVNSSATTPVTLTALAMKDARGSRVVLTEDSCIANEDWLARLLTADYEGRAAVGGSVEIPSDISTPMWAFAYVDFFRYTAPLKRGASPSLSVCNVAYRAEHLRAVEDQWREGFHETNVNDALVNKFGPLWLEPDAVVLVRRDVALSDAIYERYAFGRLFGVTRISGSGRGRRMSLALLCAGLPFLLMGRMTSKALRETALFARFCKAVPILFILVVAWSWGEWLGYVTRRLPRSLSAAPERTMSHLSSGAAG